MTQYDHIIIRYGEITLKKRNRKTFVSQLLRNVKKVLAEYKSIKFETQHERMYVHLSGEDHLPIIDRLTKVFGIYSISPALKTEKDLEKIKEAAIAYVAQTSSQFATFKVTTKRADKSFPYSTDELNHQVGGYILQNNQHLRVDVHNPDLNVKVEIRKDAVYISGETILGAGGLPIGTGGKAMLMLSGGLDSPVAGFMAMKRGVEVECVHFFSPPYTSERAKQKVVELAQKLAGINGKMVLHIVPFTETQLLIQKQIPANYSMTSTRRLMLRIADELRKKRDGLAIITGESLGQVASQTMESMYAINEVTNTPILRPLISMDKTEIMDLARKIDTHDISIRPFEDCCTIFTPTSPKTKPKREKVNYYESFVEFDSLIETAVEQTETIIYNNELIQSQEQEMDNLL